MATTTLYCNNCWEVLRGKAYKTRCFHLFCAGCANHFRSASTCMACDNAAADAGVVEFQASETPILDVELTPTFAALLTVMSANGMECIEAWLVELHRLERRQVALVQGRRVHNLEYSARTVERLEKEYAQREAKNAETVAGLEAKLRSAMFEAEEQAKKFQEFQVAYAERTRQLDNWKAMYESLKFGGTSATSGETRATYAAAHEAERSTSIVIHKDTLGGGGGGKPPFGTPLSSKSNPTITTSSSSTRMSPANGGWMLPNENLSNNNNNNNNNASATVRRNRADSHSSTTSSVSSSDRHYGVRNPIGGGREGSSMGGERRASSSSGGGLANGNEVRRREATTTMSAMPSSSSSYFLDPLHGGERQTRLGVEPRSRPASVMSLLAPQVAATPSYLANPNRLRTPSELSDVRSSYFGTQALRAISPAEPHYHANGRRGLRNNTDLDLHLPPPSGYNNYNNNNSGSLRGGGRSMMMI